MKIVDEFKTFVSRGNVVDLAVGVMIGAAFGKIVASVVSDLISPVIGLILGRLDLSKLAAPIGTNGEGEPILLAYGAFLQTCIDFLITAAAIFLIVKVINTMHRKKEEAPPAPPEPPAEVKLLEEIRDLLKRPG